MKLLKYNPDRKILILNSKERMAIKGIPINEDQIERYLRNEDLVLELTEAWLYLTGQEQPIRDLERTSNATADLINASRVHGINNDAPMMVINAARILACRTITDEWTHNKDSHRETGRAVIDARYGSPDMSNPATRETTRQRLTDDIIKAINDANDNLAKISGDDVMGVNIWD